jgi:amino acid adenylation domain-containing protein
MIFSAEQTTPALAVGTLQKCFEATAAESPHAVALTFESAAITYSNLNSRANQIAHGLIAQGAGPETLIGLFLERTPELIAGMLGIVKSGGAYVPLDKAYPADRLSFLLEDSKAPLILTERRLLPFVPPSQARVICIEDCVGQSEDNPASRAELSNAAYVIYTSGSTGTPKGVVVTHANVIRLFEATQPWFTFGPRDVWTFFHSHAFDFSVWEIWGALLYGGRLVVVPWKITRTPQAFRSLLAAEQVTVLNQTPTAFAQLMLADESAGSTLVTLRTVIFGGEALELRSLAPWFARYGDQKPQLVNMYGITETTVHVTYRPLSVADVKRGSVIGKPIPDLMLELRDSEGRQSSSGDIGEIWVGGAGVARGYLNRPELTAQRFVETNSCRYYRSGDLARYLQNGDIEYLGRADRQIKLRGHRIEPGEIENILTETSGVRSSFVMLREDTPGDQRLVAYVINQPGLSPLAEDLRLLLASRLPAYMVPSAFVILSEFPLTTNGKLDQVALPKPVSAIAPVPAQTKGLEETIETLWRTLIGTDAAIAMDDNFFDLGGHSLLLVRMHEQLRASLNADLSPIELFEYPTIRSLATRIRKGPSSAPAVSGDRPSLCQPDSQRREVLNRAERQRLAFHAGKSVKR